MFKNRKDVLEKVELLVAGRGPEVVPMDRQAFLFSLAFLIDDGHTALLAERRVGHDHLVVFPAMATQRVADRHRHLVRPVRADPVQQHVHAAKTRHAVHQLDAVKGTARQLDLLLTVQLIVLWIRKIVVSRQ